MISDKEEATHRWIKPVTSQQEDLSLLLRDPREEDAPELHREHQALTRLGRPSVTLICLYGSEREAFMERQGAVFSLDDEPDLTTATSLLHRSVKVSQPDIFAHFMGQCAPKGWRKSSLLRHCRPLFLSAGNRWQRDGLSLHLDEQLGLVVERGSTVED